MEAPPAADARAVARLSTDYMLRVLRLLADLQGGDLLTAVIVQAIIAANTRHLNDAVRPGPSASGLSELPPDTARKPVSVLALAGSLGLPFETTRRHVNKLIQSGACRRVAGGVIVPAAALEDPRFVEAAETNIGYVLHFMRGLRRVGLAID